MIKQLILLFHVFGMFLYQFIFSGDITVTQQLPSKMNSGEEVIVEVIIHKNSLTGFSKVQQTIPPGFSAEAIETKGATFSFKDNKVKFIWMALPSDEEFTISYKLKADETTTGDFTIDGKFSFIFESERKNIEIPVATISVNQKILADVEEEVVEEEVVEEEVAKEEVVEEEVVEEEVVEEEVVEEEVVEEEVVEEEVAEEKVVEEVIAKEEVAEGKISINCERKITEVSAGNYAVSIKIKKENIKGFSKIIEIIPTGFTATEKESKDGIFSFKNQEAKILWMSIPKDKELEISYNLIANPDNTNKEYQINGSFSYLENDVTKQYVIQGTSLELNLPEELLAEEQPEETDMNEEKTPTSTPTPETGVNYKIQVGAGHKKVAVNYFATNFNLTDEVSTINHEGWIKYLVGSYGEYKQARDKRNTVRSNVKTAFVTAYNSGKRITVQEALMISNQKWYK